MGKSASPCLDEEDIFAFAVGQLDPHRRGQALVHVDECENCRSLVAELARENGGESHGTASAEEGRQEEPPGSEPPLVDGRFRLKAPLGSGAMGTVYRAYDEKLGMDVALKLLRNADDDGERSARAFARELTVGRRVTHANVCRLHDAGRHGDASYITMELVEGETLAELLLREEISEARALEILHGVAEGLAAVHAQGIVHRDLKPANVMIARETGRPIITDFGFAAELDSKQSRRLVGTPSFWAPEQARGEPPTPASDVYSLGLVAYRLLARREFSLSERTALTAVPLAHRRFVAACLAPRPTDRPRNAAEALRVLRRRASPSPWVAAPIAALALGGACWLVLSSSGASSSVTPSREPSSKAPAELSGATTARAATEASTTASSITVTSATTPSAVPRNPNHSATASATRAPVVHRGVAGPAASVSAPAPRPEPDPLYRH